MWAILLCVVGVVVVYYTHCVNRWRNPKCNGLLPPGSMGFPVIGETLDLIVPSYSLDLHPFIKTRIQRFGPIFRSNVIGRPIAVSTDPQFNNYILQQEGKLVEMWQLDTFSKLFGQDGESRTNASGITHKYARSLTLTHFGAESLKERLLPRIENTVSKTLHSWASQQASVEVKHATAIMACNFIAKQLFSYDVETSSDKNLNEKFKRIADGFLSLPLNIPGTTHYKCLKDKEKIASFLKDTIKEKINSPELRQGDLLDQMVNDMDKEKFLTEDFVVDTIFGLLFASIESISTALTLGLKLITENPSVLEELKAEHEGILKGRETPNSPLTWAEYNSMTFTLQVINEILRLGNVAPWILRRALQDIQVKGYTIPSGWVIMLVNSALHVNPATYKNPLEFNPWRWKEFDSFAVSKNLIPFGGGKRQCAGSEFTKVLMAIFLHYLVTGYSWKIVKEGNIGRSPMLGFGEGMHISFAPKA